MQSAHTLQVPEAQDDHPSIPQQMHEGVYTWVDTSLLPLLYPTLHYNSKLLNFDDSLMIEDMRNYRLTPLRMVRLLC